jgi:nucleotide-binding universal stress UspA family protein
MISSILVATDGSADAEKAVDLAVEIAKAPKAGILLLHAVPSVALQGIPKGYEDWADFEHLTVGDILQAVGEDILQHAEKKIRHLGVEELECILASGPAASAILETAESKNVDMIVMGSRGLSDIENLLLGSVSHRVCQLAPCSCLTVR